MRYWVIKANPRQNDWDAMLVPGRDDVWHSGRTPREWTVGDRVFCWESTPALRMVGLAELRDTDVGVHENGDKLFQIRYLTSRIGYNPSIQELRAIPELKGSSFLKTGPATTLFPLTETQAQSLFRILAEGNPDVASVWPAMATSRPAEHLQGLDLNLSLNEGNQYLASHLRRERRPELVAAKKKLVLAQRGHLGCEACGFDFASTYGKLGEEFCEVHHLRPLSEVELPVTTRLDDLAVVCSNCHRMLHRSNPTLSLAELRERISKTA